MKILRSNILFRFLTICLYHHSVQSVTLVYNMRIRRAFVTSEVETTNNNNATNNFLTSVVPLIHTRKNDIEVDTIPNSLVHENRRVVGSLLYGQYGSSSRHWWFDAATGIEKDNVKFTEGDPFKASRFGFDDVLLTSGYRYFKGDRTQIIGYGLAGFPTRQKVELTDRYGPLVGSRFYTIGCGGEYSHAFLHSQQRTLLGILQGRFVHGFKRSWHPILPKGDLVIPGNFSDILLVAQYRERRTIIQTGYDLTIYTNQGKQTSKGTTIINPFTFNSGFISISHGKIEGFFDKPTYFGLGASIARSKKFNAKTIYRLYFTILKR